MSDSFTNFGNEFTYDNKEEKQDTNKKGKMSLEDFKAMKEKENKNIEPMKPYDKSDFYMFSRDYALFSTVANPEVINIDLKGLIDKLNQTGHILRYSNNPKSLETYFVKQGAKFKYYLPFITSEQKKTLDNVEVDKPTKEAMAMAKHYSLGQNNDDKFWRGLRDFFRVLNALVIHQIYGKDLKTPVKFILVYTTDGVSSLAEGYERFKKDFSDYKKIYNVYKIAEDAGIKVINLNKEADRLILNELLNK